MALHPPALVEHQLKISGGVPVRQGTTTTWGSLDFLGAGGLSGTVVGESIELRLATGILPELAIDSYLTADGKRYRVRDLQKENDGAEIVAYLAEAD
ncbi:hypothetical protein [Gaopeijia maritima]|uniref:hypothetical protein n=1 Tax=Gaopeijia maritima TaxID=3119007 RepID=UPI00328C2DF0